jgi:hypothetical protein
MSVALQNLNGILTYPVDKSVRVVNSPTPPVTMPKRLRVADSVIAVAGNVLNKQIDAF